MIYDSLLLNCGGGIISSSKQSSQYAGAAALAIGIGGTGVDALSTLKGKVYQQLKPDNPGEPIPRYDHIQFLAIDSDETEINQMRGNARIERTEFFPIGNPNLGAVLAGKETIKKNPLFNWMEIDRINELLSPQGAGGIRQVGRYLLIDKAGELRQEIERKCLTALQGLGTPTLDIYIFAGISGGTGSGCFLDVCYIVQNILESQGWNGAANIMGFCFLPDVVTSKPDVRSKQASVEYNNSNGYAAMKELDYLMGLKDADDRFQQNYGSFKVNTQNPPVNLCHLISATKADGSVIEDGYHYGIHVASDYVMAYLADVELGGVTAGEDDHGLTMRGHLANVTRGVSQLARNHGANLSYHVLGASNAEIPMTQISTYLASGFYKRFQDRIGQDHKVITKTDVDDWFEKMGLTSDRVYDALVQDTDQLYLPEIDYGELAALGAMTKGKLPMPWANSGNDWQSRCAGKRERNRSALNGKLETCDYEKVPSDSLIGKVFRKLYDLSVDPNYGPYYAAGLLHHAGYDMMSAVDGAIKTVEGQRSDQILQLRGRANDGLNEYVMQCSSDFCMKHGLIHGKKNYARYLDSARQWCLVNNDINAYADLITTLQTLKKDLGLLYTAYFIPLLNMLNNLKSTFIEDDRYLSSPAAAAATTYTWRILNFSDVKDRLDGVIDALELNELVDHFMSYILKGYDKWQTGDEGKISRYISEKMESVFQAEMNRSLQDYLFDVYPNAGGNVDLLAQEVERSIVDRIHKSALPMFWCDPEFQLQGATFPSSSISVPHNAIAICNAADTFKTAHTEYVVRKTGLQDRLFALRFFSGVPFYAYQGVTLLKDDYDKAGQTESGVGSHLYALTNRGEDGSGQKNWRSFLPVPFPYSKNPALVSNAADALSLYEKGVRLGMIQQTENGEFAILQTQPITLPEYTLEDFIENNIFLAGKLESLQKNLEKMRQELYEEKRVMRKIRLKNDGAINLGNSVVDRVRKDYFVHYPKLHQIVKDEIAKCEALEQAITSLASIQAEYAQYHKDLDLFCGLLFYRLISCTDGTGETNYRKIVHITYAYVDGRGQEQNLIFTKNDGALPREANYPLYLAFLTFCSLDAGQSPRRELEESVLARRTMLLQAGDNLVGFILEQEWDQHRLADLDRDTRSMLNDQRTAVMRFYYGLVKCIQRYRDQFSHEAWIQTDQSAVETTPVPQTSKVWTLWNNEKYLQVYEKNFNYAWDQTTSQWIPVTPDMLIWNEADQNWHPLSQDAQGNIINMP